MRTSAVPEPKRTRRGSKAVTAGWSIYQHIAAVLAAFAIAAMLGHFWDIGWRGWLATLTDVWSATIRPAVAWVFHVLITIPFDVEVPLWIRDYITVGFITSLSLVREIRRGGPPAFMAESIEVHDFAMFILELKQQRDEEEPGSDRYEKLDRKMRYLQQRISDRYEAGDGAYSSRAWAILTPVLWPLTLVFFSLIFVAGLIMRGPDSRMWIGSVFFVLSPIIYLLLLLVMNFWVMPYV